MEHSITEPKVTVLMPVYNGGSYLREALQSILDQSFSDFEFLIIDDGSVDQSVEVIHSYHDPRIRLVHNHGNFGLVFSLNRGLDLAQGEYIARMDSDDISMPDRLGKQVKFMDENPEVGICGGLIEYFMGKQLVLQLPVHDHEIKQALANYNPIAHPTVMFRAAVLKKHNIYYDSEYRHVEDYELWTRLAVVTRLANIPEILLQYRIHPEQIGRKYSAEQELTIKKIKARMDSKGSAIKRGESNGSPNTGYGFNAGI